MLFPISFSTVKTKFGLGAKTILMSPWFYLILAAELWGFSLQAFNLDAMQDWGLLSIFPVSIILAYLLLLFSFASLYRRQGEVNDAVFVAHVLLLVLMIHGTPYFLSGTVRYSWAYKHVGIIDYIIRHGSVNPNIDILSVYHNWPGFFAVNALFTQLSGFDSAKTYAGWAPFFFESLFALSLLALFRLFTPDRRLQWLGVWIFLLTNWVGQDYFAPQAITYFMMICVLVLVMRYFGPKKALSLNSWTNKLLSKIGRFFRVPSRFVDHITTLKLPTLFFGPALSKSSELALGAIVLLVFGVIVSVHQLTPIMGIATVLVLALFGIIRWRSLPFWLLVITVLWLAFPARAYNSQVIDSTVESFGQINDTVDKGLVNVDQVSPGQVIVSWMGRGLTASIFLFAAFGVFQRFRKGYLDLPAILLSAAPIVVLFLNSYGGEALFRVYFFSLPGLTFLAAGAIIPRDALKRGWLQPIVIGVLSLALLIAFLFAYYGKEHQYTFTKAEEEAAMYIYTHATPNSLLVEGSRNYPSQLINYDYFTYVALDREPIDSINNLMNDPATVLYGWLSNTTRYTSSYLIITRSQKIYVDEVGRPMKAKSLDTIEDNLKKSDMFQVVFENEDAIIFTIRKKTP